MLKVKEWILKVVFILLVAAVGFQIYQIHKLSNSLDEVSSDITTMQSDIDTVKSDLDDVKSSVDDIASKLNAYKQHGRVAMKERGKDE